MENISVLFVMERSIYKDMGLDCWDIKRDASKFSSDNVVICHPPCAQWSRLRHFANKNEAEKNLALFAVQIVRRNGGILEHPVGSELFKYILPRPGEIDKYGGFTICVNQSWFGHVCEKKTFLYIKGIKENNLPDIPISFDCPTHVIGSPLPKNIRPQKLASKKIRLYTPELLAKWLINTAVKIHSLKK